MEAWSDERLLTETPEAPAAFAVFYRRHEGSILGYFMRRTGNAELAADLAAETFAAALLGAPASGATRNALAWLYGIARHRLMRSIERGRVEDRARRKLAMPRLEIDDELVDRIERLAGEERAFELLDQLPPAQAEAVRAHVLDDRSYKDIADTVKVSEAVVRKRVSRGLLTLKDCYERVPGPARARWTPLPTGASAGGVRGPGGAGWRRRRWPCARRRSSSPSCRGRSPAAGPRALRRP